MINLKIQTQPNNKSCRPSRLPAVYQNYDLNIPYQGRFKGMKTTLRHLLTQTSRFPWIEIKER